MNFSKLSVLLICASLSIASTQAADLECSLVDDFDSWSVYVNTDRDLAIFFDNDHNIAMGYVSSGGLECIGCPYNYHFAGKDASLVEEFTLSLYNDGTATGQLVVGPGTKDEETHAMTCKELKKGDSITWDDAREAIRNAPKNDGSTRF